MALLKIKLTKKNLKILSSCMCTDGEASADYYDVIDDKGNAVWSGNLDTAKLHGAIKINDKFYINITPEIGEIKWGRKNV